MTEQCFDNINAQFMKSDEVQTEHRILVMFFMKNAQGSLSLNIERAEKLCNELALAIIEAKEHADPNSFGKSESFADKMDACNSYVNKG